MDTREKIIAGEAAAEFLRANPGKTAVSGYFDPVLPLHALRLHELGTGLLVIIRDSEDALLPVRARAEIVAGLACVSHVLVDVEPGALSTAVRLEDDDSRIRRHFIDHVRSRRR